MPSTDDAGAAEGIKGERQMQTTTMATRTDPGPDGERTTASAAVEWRKDMG
jgi:hypothetical protein